MSSSLSPDLRRRTGGHNVRVIFSEDQIAQRVAELGAEITEAYPDGELLVLGLLKGSFIFLSDLVRRIDRPLHVDFLVASSYGAGKVSSGTVRLLYDPETPLAGKHILLVEDIIDSGRTMKCLVELLAARNPASLAICSLLDKQLLPEPLPALRWADDVLTDIHRFHALVVGPGLGRDDDTRTSVADLVARTDLPIVVDGDGLAALPWNPEGSLAFLRDRRGPVVLTPHDGEFTMLTGSAPGTDRVAAAHRLSDLTGAVVLLKGPVTIVAEPSGATYFVTNGDERLATAGTGDVLAGVIGALLARGAEPARAAAAGAWLHAAAAAHGPRRGLVASDILLELPGVIP